MEVHSLHEFQATYEQRFGCCICFAPKLHMVSGQCQHRICDECLYDGDNRRPCMDSCPMCQMSDSFPRKRPIIPTQVIEIQRCLGVQTCTLGCGAEMWYWEVEDHERTCRLSGKSRSTVTKSPTRRRSRVQDLGTVSVTSRLKRNQGKPATRSTRFNTRTLRNRRSQENL